MPNAEPRANYCSLWSGSNLWNIWVNYLPPLARLSQVSWPWHALFMFNIIMKSPLCKLCNYFKWSYNNVRHLTGCSSQNKIQPSWFRGGLSNSNLSILRNCTMIHSWCGPVKIHRIATIVSRERIESFIMDKQIKTKYVVSTDFVWQNTYLPSVLISNHQQCAMTRAEVTRGPGRVTPPGPESPQSSVAQSWPDSHKAHISSHRAQELWEKWIERFPCVSEECIT